MGYEGLRQQQLKKKLIDLWFEKQKHFPKTHKKLRFFFSISENKKKLSFILEDHVLCNESLDLAQTK